MQPEILPSASRLTRTARFFNHLHRYKNLARRRWWVLPITLALGIGIKVCLILTSAPMFVSVGQMTVSVKLQISGGSVYSEEVSQFLGTQVAYMKSAIVLNRAVDRVRALKPNLPYSPVKLQISVLPKTTIFNLQAFGTDPEYTRAYLDACMEEYMNFKKEMRTTTSDLTLAGITEQLVSLERDLKRYENDLLSFQASNSVVFLEQQGKGADSRLALISSQQDVLKTEFHLLVMLDLDQNLERQQKEAAGAEDQKAQDGDPFGILHSGYLKAKQDIQLMKAELQEWSVYLKPRHPRIIKLNEDIARQERLLEIYKQQSLEQLENRRNSLALQITNLDNEIKEGKIKSLDISQKMAEFDRIRANKQRTQNLYDRLLATMQTLGVDKDISQESVAVMQRASPPIPSDTSLVKSLIIAAVLGLLAGVGVLLLVDRFDDRPTSFTDLQDMFDEPVLGQIPKVQPAAKDEPLRLIHEEDERHAFLEAYRNLRSSLLYMATEGKRPKTILVTSAIPSDGKSMTTANLAVTMALAGSKVLLVDGDLRRGLLHRHFGLETVPGLTEVLSGDVPWRQAAKQTTTPNLSFIPRGKVARNPSEMFLSPSMLDLIKEVSASFDYVIFDTAPVMAADDVTSLAPRVEGVIFVIRAGYTSARVARASLDLLYQREVDVLGLVFNAVETNASEYYYYKYKDYYSKPPAV